VARGLGRPGGSGVVWPSAKLLYALRACAVLATAYPKQRLKAGDIARDSKVPVRFLSAILVELRSAGIVDARRGHNGGYVLAREPREISVAELTVAIHRFELFAPTPTGRSTPRLSFVDELQEQLREVANKAFCTTTLADLSIGGSSAD
jgi:Rrf2 family protein